MQHGWPDSGSDATGAVGVSYEKQFDLIFHHVPFETHHVTQTTANL